MLLRKFLFYGCLAAIANTAGVFEEKSDSVLVEVSSQPLVPVITSSYSDGLVNASATLVCLFAAIKFIVILIKP